MILDRHWTAPSASSGHADPATSRHDLRSVGSLGDLIIALTSWLMIHGNGLLA